MTDSRLGIVAHALHIAVCGQTLDPNFDLFPNHERVGAAILAALDAAEPERDLEAENRAFRFRLEQVRAENRELQFRLEKVRTALYDAWEALKRERAARGEGLAGERLGVV